MFATVALRIKALSAPGRADQTSANLTPASGRQDHTTSPYAATSLVRSLCNRSQAEARPAIHRAQNAAASTAPLPASVTIMIRPSGGVGCENSRCDLGWVGTKIFFGKSEIRLDSPVNKPPDGQISRLCRSIRGAEIPDFLLALQGGPLRNRTFPTVDRVDDCTQVNLPD